MNIVAKKVKHKALGIGRVAKIVDNRIFVRFENGNTLSFKYPEDMLNVLFFVNPDANCQGLFNHVYKKVTFSPPPHEADA